MADPVINPNSSLTNPYQEYEIRSVNPQYAGNMGNSTKTVLQFRNGMARALPLSPLTASEDDIRQRIAHLHYFQNVPLRAVPKRVWDESRQTMIIDTVQPPDYKPAYTVEARGAPLLVPVRLREKLHAPDVPLAYEPDDPQWVTGGPNLAEREPEDLEREEAEEAAREARRTKPATRKPVAAEHPLDRPEEPQLVRSDGSDHRVTEGRQTEPVASR